MTNSKIAKRNNNKISQGDPWHCCGLFFSPARNQSPPARNNVQNKIPATDKDSPRKPQLA